MGMFTKKRTLDESCATVVYLRNAAVVSPSFYLAQKKQNIHTHNGEELPESMTWNSYGGKWKEGDTTIYSTAKRELYEESGGVKVCACDLTLGARVEFFWPGNTTNTRNMEVYFFVAHIYSKYPEETDSMGKPELFTSYDAPYKEMMPADEIIIPIIMSGKSAEGSMFFQKNEKGWKIKDKKLRVSPAKKLW